MANISRDSFNESKNYDKVILQQGRPITDYDWNEMQDIQRVKLRRVISELFGDGAIGDGFRLFLDNGVLKVTAGTAYVKGYRVNLPVTTTVTNAPTSPGTYKAYLKVTEQEIDSIMDPDIKHSKLPIEPTRRIKIMADVEFGTSVPTDTATDKYFFLADVTVSGGSVTSVTDGRVVKETQSGSGFTIKSNVTLGDTESNVLNFVGRIQNTSNNFGGVVYIDDSATITGNLVVSGTTTFSGAVRQIGKYELVGQLILFGVAGDLQHQTDSVTWEDLTQTLYGLFTTGTNNTFPSVPSGATRYYRLRVVYSDNIAPSDGISAQIRIFNENNNSEFQRWSLPVVNGSLNGSRKYLDLPMFQANLASNMRLQVRINNVAGNLSSTNRQIAILHVQLLAFDVYQ